MALGPCPRYYHRSFSAYLTAHDFGQVTEQSNRLAYRPTVCQLPEQTGNELGRESRGVSCEKGHTPSTLG